MIVLLVEGLQRTVDSIGNLDGLNIGALIVSNCCSTKNIRLAGDVSANNVHVELACFLLERETGARWGHRLFELGP